MAITILPESDYGSTAGRNYGNVLGNAISRVAESKLQQLMQKQQNQQQQQQRQQQIAQQAQGFVLAGLNPQQALGLALSPESVQKQYFENYGFEPQGQQQGFGQQFQQQQQQQQPSQLSQQLQPLQGLEGKNLIDVFQQLSQQGQPQNLQQLIGQGGFLNQRQQLPQSSRVPSREQKNVPQATQNITQPGQVPLNLKQRQALQIKEASEKRRESFIEQREADKETLPFYKDTIKQGNAAKNNDKRLNRMEQLIKTGKLSSTGFNSVLKTLGHGIFGVGLDLKGLQNPESQEFEKLSNDFIKDAKEIFGGGRLTDADLNAFLQTIPSLSLSNEGKLRVIQNMRQFNEASKIKEKALRDIIKENNGRRPRNLEILVDEKAAPQLDALSNQFKQSFEATPDNSLVGDIFRATLPNFLTQGINR